MMSSNIEIVLFAVLGILFMQTGVNAQCVRGNGYAYCPDADALYLLTETSLGAITVSHKEIKWRINFPEDAAASELVVAADRVVFAVRQYPSSILAFDALTGDAVWHVERNRIETMGSQGPYIFAETDDPEGLIALDSRNGKIVWSHEGKKRGFAHIIKSSNGELLTTLFAVDIHSGRILKRWPRDWDVSTATFAGDLRVIGTRYAWPRHETLAAYSGTDFKLRWTWSDPKKPIVAGIVEGAEDLLVATYPEESFGPGDATLEWISASTGKTVHTKTITADYMLLPDPIALVHGLAIFVMADTENTGVVQAFDAATGEQKWIAHTDRRLTDGPVCDERRCFIGSVTHEVLEIDAQTGAQTWLSLPKE